ncbi:GNAT family N-acetyltransferase [Streptomyces sp. NBC_01387]|uniref:GNAT family N-acetyltransferase n=1 Tax=unclassified Streptomyces TaxID=2593676 RepID=UPI0020252911|nr:MULTISPECIES: GNAT family N-acetyltransferase [unclassified Streptomyces]MCX4551651.1 GNAT family N-acetyltransferase [Streptomyces sp. NBC_01500]WSC23034.1 GNAT family N-acetyltransferase [Streptomyces sp. NBC_01766]WSV56945.1 GNAT family N-acetyltransferase [Streptomyces sp. NBC_01014]
MTRGYEVRVVGTPDELEACFAVRNGVFVVEQGVSAAIEYDAHDATAVHVLAVDAEGPLGTGRLLLPDPASGEAVGSLGRLAVTPVARGRGVGAALVRAIEDTARDRGLSAVDLHAQTHALGFYERLGYEAYGPEFLDADIEHRAMRRAI